MQGEMRHSSKSGKHFHFNYRIKFVNGKADVKLITRNGNVYYITYANISLQRKSWLAETQIGARLIDACAVDARRIGALVDICK